MIVECHRCEAKVIAAHTFVLDVREAATYLAVSVVCKHQGRRTAGECGPSGMGIDCSRTALEDTAPL